MKDNIISGNAESSSKKRSSSPADHKMPNTVEDLQHHLEIIEERRMKASSQGKLFDTPGPFSPGEDTVSLQGEAGGFPMPQSIDVDHMICSGVTVAGFKPRAIIRKRSKTTIPPTAKDNGYWQKRRKNNDSARKSRESKKEREKKFYKRALELEYENIYLHECLRSAEAELAALGHSFVPPTLGAQTHL
ncbi:cell death specification protein 2-like [Aplysia californica]|uniref:Cell death specification protein 2-like n=1 Tax=Aplysia californica TaxID=6500 RepID=A0ABM0JDY2_APLCA|nr:cell death specification protein 2-like [Aplysia californica]